MARVQEIQKSAKSRPLVRFIWILLLAFHGVLLYGCSSSNSIKVKPDEAIEVEQTQLQESNLLDVGIIVFKAGQISNEQKEDEGITPEIRKAEARYISYHLRETMQNLGRIE